MKARSRHTFILTIMGVLLAVASHSFASRMQLVTAVYYSDALVIGKLESFTAGTFIAPKRRFGRLNVTRAVYGDVQDGPLGVEFPKGWGPIGLRAAFRRASPFLMVAFLGVAVARFRRSPRGIKYSGVAVGICAGCLAAGVLLFCFGSVAHHTGWPRLNEMRDRQAIWPLYESSKGRRLKTGPPYFLPLRNSRRNRLLEFAENPNNNYRQRLQELLHHKSKTEKEAIAALREIATYKAESTNK